MDLGLKGKVALVTGSSQGIGKAIALGLAEEGVKIAICARNEKQLRETAEEIESATNTEILAVRADLTEKKTFEHLLLPRQKSLEKSTS